MDNEQEPQYFTQVPTFLNGKGLKATEKIVYGIVYTMLNVNKKCFMSNAKIAEAAELKTNTVSHIISKLSEMGLINRHVIYKKNSKEIDKRYLTINPLYNSTRPHVSEYNTPLYDSTRPHVSEYKDNRLLNKSLNRLPNNNMSSSDEHDHSAAREVIRYLNKQAGKHFRNTTSNYRLIEPRLKDYSINDLKQVIDNKCAEWLNTDMDKYLRIETLFRASKIDGYLNEKPKKGHDVDGLDF